MATFSADMMMYKISPQSLKEKKRSKIQITFELYIFIQNPVATCVNQIIQLKADASILLKTSTQRNQSKSTIIAQ